MGVIATGKGKKSLIAKTLERCRSIGSGRNKSSSSKIGGYLTTRSKSWTGHDAFDQEERRVRSRGRVAPEGCFTVYVGPEKQRFVVKTEYANHPLFKLLLEEAEREYGYNSQGPLALPCNVDVFYKVLMEMDGGCEEIRQGCGFIKRYGSSYNLLSPSRMVDLNRF